MRRLVLLVILLITTIVLYFSNTVKTSNVNNNIYRTNEPTFEDLQSELVHQYPEPEKYKEEREFYEELVRDKIGKNLLDDLKKRGKKYYFKHYPFNSDKKRFIQIVWDSIIKESIDQLSSEELKEIQKLACGFSKEYMSFLFVDINNDKDLDFIAIPGGGWCCGSSYMCGAWLFIGPDYKKNIDLGCCFTTDTPVYVLNTKHDGYNDFVKNFYFCTYSKEAQDYDCQFFHSMKYEQISDKV